MPFHDTVFVGELDAIAGVPIALIATSASTNNTRARDFIQTPPGGSSQSILYRACVEP
ncbi:hypothetical protein [Halocalculus aciditolerans]|uniref:Uncharacterized protein n=1 Tax=Halocalculus aciditolerans TaxID=1383812 RepID=A0A830FB55_9EURY|nr:hypothetical protein [Halocalculus aciditolerans]GGL57615.1 hypothetical protein GCM10009039_14740 [Halocalculus aciditolerans]